MTIHPATLAPPARRPRVRPVVRRAATSVCGQVPAGWLLHLRAGYLDRQRSPLARRWRRGLLEVARLRGIPQDEPFPIPDHPQLSMAPADSRIAHRVFWLGLDGHEPGEVTWWGSLVAAHRSALEIGANIGLYTIVGAAAAPGVPYHAVEPNPASYQVLRDNIALNGLANATATWAAVVGDRDATTVTLRFPDADRHLTAASAYVDGAADLAPWATRATTVPALAARGLIEGHDLVKLDIEGLEAEVLGAVRGHLVEAEPTILVEVLDDAVRLQRFLADLVEDTTYRCFVIRSGRPRELAPAIALGGRLRRDHGTRDLTLVSTSRAGALGL